MSKCTRHPRYQALRKPRTLCADCWRMWHESNRPRAYALADLLKRLNHFLEQSDDAAYIQVVCHDGMDPSDLAPVTSVELDDEGRLVINA